MADKKATLTIELKDFLSKGIGGISAKLAVLRQGFLAISSVVQSVIGVFQSFLNEYAAQELAVNKLTTALKNQGITSKAVSDDLLKFATELQNTTTIADDMALEAMALGTTFGLVGEDLKRTTKAAADMSAAMGIDLKTTMLLLGKAAVGETGTLSRYGIVINESIPKAQRFEEALRQLNSRFGGAAAAQTETYAGKVAQLGNQFSDLKENIGAMLMPAASLYLKWLKDVTEWTNKKLQADDTGNSHIREQISLLEQQAKKQTAGINWRDVNKDQLDNLRITQARIKILKDELALKESGGEQKPRGFVDPEAAERKAQEEKERKKKAADLISDSQLRVDTEMLTQEQLADLKTNQQAEELMRLGQHNLAIQLLENQQTKNTIAANQQRAANFRSTMGVIATLSDNHNKTLRHLGKTAAVTQATMDTYAAANVALRSAPPPFNFALAALVTAAGLANVAKISGVKLAEGGMIMPRSGGVPAIMSEVGKAEVAIPLDDERTKDKLRDTFGGGEGTTIVIQAGTIIADEYSMDQFAQKIDEKLYGLQRNRRSNL